MAITVLWKYGRILYKTISLAFGLFFFGFFFGCLNCLADFDLTLGTSMYLGNYSFLSGFLVWWSMFLKGCLHDSLEFLSAYCCIPFLGSNFFIQIFSIKKLRYWRKNLKMISEDVNISYGKLRRINIVQMNLLIKQFMDLMNSPAISQHNSLPILKG